MDGIDGDELDAQELLDKMAEMGVIEEGITVDKFEQKDGALTLDLSSLKESSAQAGCHGDCQYIYPELRGKDAGVERSRREDRRRSDEL